jgi:hypothetical protein
MPKGIRRSVCQQCFGSCGVISLRDGRGITQTMGIVPGKAAMFLRPVRFTNLEKK